MIRGLGIDLVEIERIRQAHARFADRFLTRVFLPDEIAYCLAKRDPHPSLAARFAAKEAVSKAFGAGIGDRIGWHDIEVRRNANGVPSIVLHRRGRDLLAEFTAKSIHLSLTHTASHAAAVAVIEA